MGERGRERPYRPDALPLRRYAAVFYLPRWWASELARNSSDLEGDEVPATPDAEGLRHFLENKGRTPWFEHRRTELTNRPLIREQAFGESLDPDKLERLGRYEVHLDRKLERMLTMLFRLKELRKIVDPG
jgi:hypothetical protein